MTGARRAASSAMLLAAASLFLWMFLAAAPLDVLADSAGVVCGPGQDQRGDTSRFAADWRHGMAGNSPLYMPGFFALGVAAWIWMGCRSRVVWTLAAESGAVVLAACVVAWTSAAWASPAVAAAFERTTGCQISAPWPAPPWHAFAQGLYTAAAWMTTVMAGRLALERRSWMPLLLIPPVTVVLALVRPWTVDDFVGLWASRARSGDAAAVGSALAIPLVAWMLILRTRRSVGPDPSQVPPDRL